MEPPASLCAGPALVSSVAPASHSLLAAREESQSLAVSPQTSLVEPLGSPGPAGQPSCVTLIPSATRCHGRSLRAGDQTPHTPHSAGGHYQHAVLRFPASLQKPKRGSPTQSLTSVWPHQELELSAALQRGVPRAAPPRGPPLHAPGAREGKSHVQASPWPSAPCMTLHKPLRRPSLGFPICNTRGTTLVQALPRGPKEQPQQVSGDEKPRRREPPAQSLSRVWPPLLGHAGRQLKGEPGPHPEHLQCGGVAAGRAGSLHGGQHSLGSLLLPCSGCRRRRGSWSPFPGRCRVQRPLQRTPAPGRQTWLPSRLPPSRGCQKPWGSGHLRPSLGGVSPPGPSCLSGVVHRLD